MALLASRLDELDELSQALSELSVAPEPKRDGGSTIKIDVGGGWWIDMTPSEAQSWVERRKAGRLVPS